MLTLPHQHGQYVLLEELAQGGMGVVYRGIHVGAEQVVKSVAIKRIRPEWSTNRVFAEMLIDEARLLTQLQHPNIAQLYELGRDHGIYFLAMEYVNGLDLRALIQRLRIEQLALPMPHAIFITLEILQGLIFAHGHVGPDGVPLRLVHRDISPHNILLSMQGEVKIADFGIAKGGHREETTGMQVKGKYAYMAPEQARGEQVDRRADLFAVGALLYELLTTRPLFDGPNDLAVLEKVREVKLPAEWDRTLHPGLHAILHRALAAKLVDRYPTAATFFTELSAFSASQQCVLHRATLGAWLCDLFPDWSHRAVIRTSTTIPPGVAAAMGVAEHTRGYTTVPATKRAKSKLRSTHIVKMLAYIGIACGSLAFRSDRAAWATRTVPPLATAALLNTQNATSPIPKVDLPALIEDATIVRRDEKSVNEKINVATTAASSQSSTPSQRGQLSVQVRPWGYVSIPGVTGKRETPLSLALKPGNYSIILSDASGKSHAARATIHEGKSTRCTGTTLGTLQLQCR